jgi:hypothetical protein
VAVLFMGFFLWKQSHDILRRRPEPSAAVRSNFTLINLDPNSRNVGCIVRHIVDGTRRNDGAFAIMPPTPRTRDPYNGGTGRVYDLPSYESSYVKNTSARP